MINEIIKTKVAPLFIPQPKLPKKEQWWAFCDYTGDLIGPFDPGTVWFQSGREVPSHMLHTLRFASDKILNEAAASIDRINNLLRGKTQTQFYKQLCIGGGTSTYGYLGSNSATDFVGMQLDDSKNGTTVAGYAGGAGGGNDPGLAGTGPGGGRGGGGAAQAGAGAGAGGGGGSYGTVGTAGAGVSVYTGGSPGNVAILPTTVFNAILANSYTQATLTPGGGGGAGGCGTGPVSGGAGGAAGAFYVEISVGTLTTVARNLLGVNGAGGTDSGTNDGGDGGGGSGGLWLGLAPTIAYGSGTINTTGGSGDTTGDGGDGGNGGNGRVIQVYFDAKATLVVASGTETQYRILRSVPLGMPVLL